MLKSSQEKAVNDSNSQMLKNAIYKLVKERFSKNNGNGNLKNRRDSWVWSVGRLFPRFVNFISDEYLKHKDHEIDEYEFSNGKVFVSGFSSARLGKKIYECYFS